MDPLIEATWFGVDRLVRASDLTEAMPEVIERLRAALGATLVSYHSCAPHRGDGPDPRVEAFALEDGSALPEALRVDDPAPPPRPGWRALLDQLQTCEFLCLARHDANPEHRALLDAWGLSSLLAVPVRSDHTLTGILLCGDRVRSTSRPLAEINTARLFADLLGSVRQQHQIARDWRQSEERRRLVESAAAEYIWETDAEGVTTYLSDRVESILGYTPAEVLGKTPFDLMPPEGAAISRAVFQSAAAERRAFRDVVGCVLHKDGRLIWTLTSALPRLGEQGVFLGYTGTTADITERRQAEQTLQASEARYRSLVESQEDLITRWDRDFRFTFANAAFCRYFHMEREAILNRSVMEVVPPDRAARVFRLIRSLSEPPYGVPMEDPVPDGEGERLLSWEAHPVFDEHAEVIEIQAVGRDVTRAQRSQLDVARRDRILEAISQAAERLLGTEEWEESLGYVLEQLGLATEVSRMLLLRVHKRDEDHYALELRKIWVASDAEPPPAWPDDLVVPISGPARMLIDRSLRDQALELKAADAPEPLRELMQTRGTLSLLAVPILIDAEWWGSFVLPSLQEPRRWSTPEVEALRISGRLLAAAIRRRRIRRELRVSEARYRDLVEGASQPILILRHDGRFLFANRFACESVGLKPEEIVKKRIWDIFPAERAHAHMEVVHRALATGQPTGSTGPTVIRGHRRWFSSRVQPLPDVGDGREAALVILQDVTDQKQREEEVLAYQAQLQQLTSEVALAEQRERRRIAAELHDRIGQALAITRIKLGAARQASPGAARNTGLEEAIRLVEQSIQDTRNLTFELSPPVLYELGLEPALEWLGEQVYQRDGLAVEFRGDQQEVNLPPEMLGFIFQSAQELVVNVVKHARASSVRMRKYRKDQRLAIEVADDGVGYDPSCLVRTDAGFGLFSIRERLRHLGGSLQVVSRPGKGTRCTIWVPLQQVETRSKGESKS